MKKIENKFINTIMDFVNAISKDKVGVYSAQASFFIMLSIFPFAMLILNMIGLTPITEDYIVNFANSYLPDSVKPLIIQIINEMYSNVSGTVISITAIVAIWSASKGVLSVMFGIYNIYNVHSSRNYFISRFISMIYTVFFVIAMVVTLVLLVFGNKLFKLAISIVPPLINVSVLYTITSYSAVFIILTLFFLIIFKVANLKLAKFRKILPGAVFSSLGWILFSFAFSIYVDNFSNMTYMYGSLTSVIIMMFWIYFCIYILFIGAEINVYFYPEISKKTAINQ